MANNSIPQTVVKFQGKNEYYITGDTAEMVLYDKHGAEKCRTVIDSEDVERCAEYRWCLNGNYVSHTVCSRVSKQREMRLHDLLLKFKGTRKNQIDHENRDALDNRKCNLRVCTHQQNLLNNSQKPGTSGFRGVYTTPNGNRWRAKIKHNGALKQIGAFGTAVAAAKAWNAKALELRGEFAVLNNV